MLINSWEKGRIGSYRGENMFDVAAGLRHVRRWRIIPSKEDLR